MPRDRDGSYLLDIDLAAARALRFVAGTSRDEFERDEKAVSAAIYQVMIIGEAVKRLSPEFRAEHAGVPWRLIAGTRDLLIHHYDTVDLGELWTILTNDLPALRAAIGPSLPTQPENRGGANPP